MTEDTSGITTQLKIIKRWIAVGALGFVLIGAGVVLFSSSMALMVSAFSEEGSEGECGEEELTWEGASDLFDRGKTVELLGLLEDRLATHPNDATAHWFKAKVHYINEEWELARQSLEKTEILAPNWKIDYTQPLLEKMAELISHNKPIQPTAEASAD